MVLNLQGFFLLPVAKTLWKKEIAGRIEKPRGHENIKI